MAGTASGVGKTTIASALMGALARRGLRVAPFKAGPDYIDPSYHTRASGEASRNLDSWLLPHSAVVELFVRAAAGKDIAVVEGVMGLYDGRASLGEEGSTAELAKVLGAPVVLVVDAAGAARSVAAVVAGFKSFDPALRLGGVILNGIGSQRHYSLCREAIEGDTGTAVMGYMPRRDDLRLPQRHLGLIPTVEGVAGREFFDRLTHQAEETLDLDRISALVAEPALSPGAPELFPTQRVSPRVRIALARDRAFSFYYQDSLDLLEAWGAELAPFSPLKDSVLPSGISGVYLGGGFPELYARELGTNRALREAIARAAGGGMPVYAECGGLMYLGRSIKDFEGKEHPMAGVIPVSSRLEGSRLTLGYRTVSALSSGPLLRRGETVRGHEFHWSVLESGSGETNAYRIVGEGRREGFRTQGVLASYIHLHMGSLPAMARRLVESCLRYRKSVAR